MTVCTKNLMYCGSVVKWFQLLTLGNVGKPGDIRTPIPERFGHFEVLTGIIFKTPWDLSLCTAQDSNLGAG